MNSWKWNINNLYDFLVNVDMCAWAFKTLLVMFTYATQIKNFLFVFKQRILNYIILQNILYKIIKQTNTPYEIIWF